MQKTPLIFIGHGSPMNAIESNIYTENWKNIGKSLQQPRAILMLSAHWITEGETHISTHPNPPMIYDMYGFPDELYEIKYPAPGNPEIAEEIISMVSSLSARESTSVIRRNHHVSVDDDIAIHDSEKGDSGSPRSSRGQEQKIKIMSDPTRGLDHGAWSVLIHLFPDANIPVVSMSLDYNAGPEELYRLGHALKSLRESGILIIGSGNIVHNLGAIDWSGKQVYDWAVDFDTRIADGIEKRDHVGLLKCLTWDTARLAHPSFDHLLPLFPLLGASDADDVIEFSTPDIMMGSLSMRCMQWNPSDS